MLFWSEFSVLCIHNATLDYFEYAELYTRDVITRMTFIFHTHLLLRTSLFISDHREYKVINISTDVIEYVYDTK